MPTTCPHCNALVTPGAPFCLSCFLPFEDEAPAAEAASTAQGAPAVPAAPTAPPPQGYIPAQPVPAMAGAPAAPPPGGDSYFFAPPAMPQAPAAPWPGQAAGGTPPWAGAPAPGWPVPPPRSTARSSRTPWVIAAAVVAAFAVLGYAGIKVVLGGTGEKTRMARAFRDGRPPDFIPAMPDFSSYVHDSTNTAAEAPGAAAAAVRALDPSVRAANDALVHMQDTLLRWAKGKATDDEVRAEVKPLLRTLNTATGLHVLATAPPSLQRGLAKLEQATTEYDIALGALQDWLDSHRGPSRVTYRLSVGDANVHWDEGVLNLYRAGGVPAPPLPHPQKG